MATSKITVSTLITADRKKVWLHYTQPEHITKWNFASDDWQCPSASNDLRKGGRCFARMEAKDGSMGFDFEAIYDEIVNGEKIVYSLGDGRVVHISFKNEQAFTDVKIVFDAEDQNPVEMQQQGWQAILNNFKKYVESV